MSGAVERSAKSRPAKDLAEGAGKTAPLTGKENFEGCPHLDLVADAIDEARYRHPVYPRDRPRPFSEADDGDREYAIRLARAALGALREAEYAIIPRQALEWLNGSGTDADGKWFGECEDAVLGAEAKYPRRYWWRSKFSAMCAAAARSRVLP